jgi:hypothetical protein
MKNLCELVFVTVTKRLFMIRSILFFVFIAGLTCGTVEAQSRGFGLGIVVGEPTGISAKLWTGYGKAIDGAVAWSSDGENTVYLHGDFLFHRFYRYKARRHRLLPYYGIGGRIKVEEKTKVGIRIPLGVNYLLANSPLDIFIEAVPLLDLAPSTDISINGAIGIRYFFGKHKYD